MAKKNKGSRRTPKKPLDAARKRGLILISLTWMYTAGMILGAMRPGLIIWAWGILGGASIFLFACWWMHKNNPPKQQSSNQEEFDQYYPN